MLATALNIAGFQLGWLACVGLAAARCPTLAAAAALGVVALHLVFSGTRGAELALLLTAAGLGTLWDSIVMDAGVVAYRSGVVIPGVVPLWDIALWMLFATTLTRSLSWLAPRPWLATAVGAVGGPLAYLAAARLGAVSLPDTVRALLLLGCGWAIFTPRLLALARASQPAAGGAPPGDLAGHGRGHGHA